MELFRGMACTQKVAPGKTGFGALLVKGVGGVTGDWLVQTAICCVFQYGTSLITCRSFASHVVE
jgi:hypothetical protein